ncbi:CheR family methyltransferase [Mangrovibacillus cuniculi]|uniref:histidine kinase n=1 Tax=Mangrovibacillus cuniculi TaxID=2593652 RepID=A0A7S8HEU6_9BACI|nr:CheR family methyltransferase [Mangrovibacillus cuniculi]QPC45740.1 PAS domain-containing protein [Mangrovibacillus cuniculi]
MKEPQEVHIVGIGASAGGLESIETFLSATSEEKTSFAYVIVQHLSPNYKSFLPQLLSKETTLPVKVLKDGERIKKNHVYICPPNYYVKMANKNEITLSKYDENQKIHLPINTFFISLAKYVKEKAVGVVLSGKGSDGTIGLKHIKEAGGLCLAQDNTAKFLDMPQNAQSTGSVDFVLPPKKMVKQIHKFFDYRNYEFSEITLREIYQLLYKQTNIDFSHYKSNSMSRRMERRMNLAQETFHSAEEYKRTLLEKPEELKKLQEDLLIGVTHFFRDDEAFLHLRHEIVPKIIENAMANQEKMIRVWSAGCSTGQEAYSIAMVFKEVLEEKDIDMNVQIFATDVNKESIKVASQGIYRQSIVTGFPSSYITKYLRKVEEGYQVSKVIRRMVVFAPHNLAKDSPFVNLDFIICRNVMIYFQTELQQKILSLFHFALKNNGFLFLGPSETIGKMGTFFEPVSLKWKTFKNQVTFDQLSSRSFQSVPTNVAEETAVTRAYDSYRPLTSHKSMDQLHLALIDSSIEPCVVIDEKEDVIFSSTGAQKFLSFPSGRAHYNIHQIVSTNLSVAIGSAIKKVIKTTHAITYKNIHTENGPVSIRVVPLQQRGSMITHFGIFFEQVKALEDSTLFMDAYTFEPEVVISQRIFDLEDELNETKQKLQNTIEELETSNEELQATNEELIAANEELQSTNEEMQSVNEELMNVNVSYEMKINELTGMNNDMDNLLISTNIATIFLNREWEVKLFTPESTRIFKLIEQDIGRSIYDIKNDLDYEELQRDLEDTLYDEKVNERICKTRFGDWYQIKMMPYRTGENKIDGVVLTFTDITQLKSMNNELSVSMQALENAPSNIVLTDFMGRIEYINEKFTYLVDQPKEVILGKKLKEVYQDFIQVQQFDDVWRKARAGEKITTEWIYKKENNQEFWERVTFIPVENSEGDVAEILRIGEEITEYKQSEKRLIQSEMLSAVGQLAAGIAHEIRNPLTSLRGFLQLMQQSKTYNESYADVMMSEFIRLESIITELMVLGKPRSSDKKMVSIHKLLNEVCLVLDSQALMSNSTIERAFVDEDVFVLGIDHELKQVFINLIKNAIEAMGSKGGVMTVSTNSLEDYIEIVVQDNGVGMPPELIERLGEPFLTTKEKGTGLGLMMTKNLIHYHEGSLVFVSEEGKGTTATITLPVSY